MKTIITLILAALACLAQESSTVVRMSQRPSDVGYTQIFDYTGTTLNFSCMALSSQNAVSTITVTSISNANPGVVTAGSHGFYYSATAVQKILVYISGATSGWLTLNGIHVLTPTGTGTFTVNLNTSGFGSFSGQSITVSTRAPKITDSVWSVTNYGVDASSNITLKTWAARTATQSSVAGLTGGITSFVFPCSAPSANQ